jgi:putative hydrolase of the HAD superfamily
MTAMPGAVDCLQTLRTAGFVIAVCSNWGWDLQADLQDTGLIGQIDVLVPSAQAGFRKPHPKVYQSTLARAGFAAEHAVFVGDSLNTDVLGPRRVGIRSVLLAKAAVDTYRGPRVGSLAAAAELLTSGGLGTALAR